MAPYRDDHDAELDAIFIPKKRTAFFPFVIGVTVVVALLGIGLKMYVMPAPVEQVDREVASEVRDMLPYVESKVPSLRGPIIAAVLVDLLRDRVPGALRRSLRDISHVGPDHRNLIWMELMTKKSVRPLWRSICHNAGPALAEVYQEGRKDGGMFMYQRCKLQRVDMMNVNHALEAGAPEILFAHAIYNHLKEAGTLTELDTRALRLLARSNSHSPRTRPAMDAPGVSNVTRLKNMLPPPPDRSLRPDEKIDEDELLDRALDE